MVKYHPELQFLTDYTAGSLPDAQALCVITHLHYCPACKRKLRELTALGAELFMQQEPLPVSGAGFERLLERIDDPALSAASAPVAAMQDPQQPNLPRTLHKLTHGDIDKLKWRRIGRSFRYSNLLVAPKRLTTLIRIKAGGSVPHHRHTGDEITVVIKGSFSDDQGTYSPGDFIVRTPSELHRPVASDDGECLCLISLETPIVLSNWFYRSLQRVFL